MSGPRHLTHKDLLSLSLSLSILECLELILHTDTLALVTPLRRTSVPSAQEHFYYLGSIECSVS